MFTLYSKVYTNYISSFILIYAILAKAKVELIHVTYIWSYLLSS